MWNCTPSPPPSLHCYFTGLLVVSRLKEEVWFGSSSRAPHCHLLPLVPAHTSLFLRLNGGLFQDNAIIFPPYFTVDALNFGHLSAKQFYTTQWMATPPSFSLFPSFSLSLQEMNIKAWQAPEWKWMWILQHLTSLTISDSWGRFAVISRKKGGFHKRATPLHTSQPRLHPSPLDLEGIS